MNGDVKEFFGWMLMIIGGLFTFLTGGCGLFFMVGLAMNGNFLGGFMLALIFSGIPCLIGWGLFAWGKSLLPKKSDKK